MPKLFVRVIENQFKLKLIISKTLKCTFYFKFFLLLSDVPLFLFFKTCNFVILSVLDVRKGELKEEVFGKGHHKLFVAFLLKYLKNKKKI